MSYVLSTARLDPALAFLSVLGQEAADLQVQVVPPCLPRLLFQLLLLGSIFLQSQVLLLLLLGYAPQLLLVILFFFSCTEPSSSRNLLQVVLQT